MKQIISKEIRKNGEGMGQVGKHLQSFETFIKTGIITEIGNAVTDDEYGCLWESITVGDEKLLNVNCGQLLTNKIISCCARQEVVELSFVRYNNGEKDFNSIAALKDSMGVVSDVEFSVKQLRAGASRMRRAGWIGVAIGAGRTATLVIAIIGVVILAASIYLLVRSKRPLKFAETLEQAARALN